MPWESRDTMSLRTEFVLFASQDGANIHFPSAVASAFHLPPATSGFAAGGRKGPPAFRTTRAYRTIPEPLV